MPKFSDHARIDAATQEFLAKGGKIQRVPRGKSGLNLEAKRTLRDVLGPFRFSFC